MTLPVLCSLISFSLFSFPLFSFCSFLYFLFAVFILSFFLFSSLLSFICNSWSYCLFFYILTPLFYLLFFSFLILFNPCGAEGLYLLQSSQTNHFSVKIPENTSNKEMWISLKLLSSRRCPGAHWKAQ